MHLSTVYILLLSIFMVFICSSAAAAPGGSRRKARNKSTDGRHRPRKSIKMVDIKNDDLHTVEGGEAFVQCYDRNRHNPPHSVSWFRGDRELLTDGSSENYQIRNHSLDIFNISLSDHNVTFACRMTFNASAVWRNTTVLVVTEAELKDQHSENNWYFLDGPLESLPSRSGNFIAPYFLMIDASGVRLKEARVEKRVLLPMGKPMKLVCPVRGHPVPTVVWRYNGDLVGSFTNDTSALTREQPTDRDSGNYTCSAQNAAGEASVVYTVTIEDNAKGIPLIESDYPKNVTAVVGQQAVLECKFHSATQPHIVWLREWDAENETKLEHGTKYDMSDPTTLTINEVDFTDSGVYMCMASNTYGTTAKSAHLSVIEPPVIILPQPPHPLLSMPYLLLICVGTLLVFAALAGLLIRRFACGRHKSKAKCSPLPALSYRRRVQLCRVMPPSTSSESSDEFLLPRLEKREESWVPNNSGSIIASQATTISYCHSMLEYELPFDEEWDVARESLDFRSEKLLGEGAFGKVVKAYRKVGQDGETEAVAVKMSKDTANEDEFLIFAQELEVMKNIGNHPAVIKFIGCSTLGGPLYMIMEYAPLGNLRDFLKKQQPHPDYETPMGMPELTRRELEVYCYQIASGMKYLHARKFIHRDLAARNILVASRSAVKISDFGLSRDTVDSDYYRKVTNGKLPVKWMAPESLSENVFTHYSDVWSFGVLMWEIMSFGDLPYSGLNDPTRLISHLQSQRLPQPPNSSDDMYSLMNDCWQWMPSDRPAFPQILNILDRIRLPDMDERHSSWMSDPLMEDNQEYLMGPFNFNTSV